MIATVFAMVFTDVRHSPSMLLALLNKLRAVSAAPSPQQFKAAPPGNAELIPVQATPRASAHMTA